MDIVILLISLVAIVLGAGWFVDGAAGLARRLHVSDFVIGAAIVGVGTSFPEMIVSLTGAFEGNGAVAVGNVVGSNIFNLLGILGLTALLFPVATTKANQKIDIPICFGLSVLVLLLAFNFFATGDPVIGRLDGLILLACFGAYMWWSLKKGRESAAPVSEKPQMPVWKLISLLVFGLTVLIIGCNHFVDEAILIARKLNVNDAFISITLIACGTSLPELAVSLAAALKKNTQMALGNVIGSNIFNISLILGLSSQVMPLELSGVTFIDFVVMIAAAGLVWLMGRNKKISRWEGAILFSAFIGYNAWLIFNQLA